MHGVHHSSLDECLVLRGAQYAGIGMDPQADHILEEYLREYIHEKGHLKMNDRFS